MLCGAAVVHAGSGAAAVFPLFALRLAVKQAYCLLMGCHHHH
jgi:hypothetical protein